MFGKLEKQVVPLLPLLALAIAAVAPGCECAGQVMGPGKRRGIMVGDPLPMEPPAVVAPGQTFTVAAAGDIAGYWSRHDLTAELLLHRAKAGRLAALLPLGDLQYPNGAHRYFLEYYAPTWGVPALKALTRPVPGNHDYLAGEDADGYFDFFNGAGQAHGPAGDRGQGYYSYDLGDWHLIALNTSDGCRLLDCRRGSPMHNWLRKDLAATTKRCVLAYAHHPRFQHGEYHGDTTLVAPLWEALYDAGAEVMLVGHEHNFQQIAPLDKAGRIDRARGIRTFVVGTGGAPGYPKVDKDEHPGALEASVTGRFGILELVLSPGAYRWRFVAVNGTPEGEGLAEGGDNCH